MKSFTKVAALAAVLSTAVVPCVSAMEEQELDKKTLAIGAAAGAGLLIVVNYVVRPAASYVFSFFSRNATDSKANDNNNDVVAKVEKALNTEAKRKGAEKAYSDGYALGKYGITRAEYAAYLVSNN